MSIEDGASAARRRVGRHWPAVFLALVVASLAIGPQWILARHLPASWLTLAIPAHKALLLAAVLASAARYGLRLGIRNWPIFAVLLLMMETALLADLDPRLTAEKVALAAFGLALPFGLVHLIVTPQTRSRWALLLTLLPVLCVALGVALQWLEVRGAYYGSASRGLRLHGATNAGWLAFLAFAGFAIALHEAIRRRQAGFLALAAGNAVLVVLTGGRMGMIASIVFATAYAGLAESVHARLGRIGTAALAIVAALALSLLSVTLVQGHYPDGIEDIADLTGRGRIWSAFLAQFLESPVFGRGLGAGALSASYYDLPHNEYLRLLLEGGVIGFAVFAGAVLLWGRQVLARVGQPDRGFVAAMFLALAAYAFTDNVLIMPPGLVPFLYLGVILSEPPAAVPPRPAPGVDEAATTGPAGRPE